MARILIVEDEPDIALGLEDDLKAEGYEAEVVRDGETACRRACEAQWDVILLDVMLPGKDGFEVCRQIRRAGVRAHVIMLTAKTHEAEKVLGLELGADDYVTKPFSPRELRARIKAAVRRVAAEAPETFRYDDVEVDFARGEVRRGGAPLEMTPMEFKLLSVFLRRRGRVLSRDQLIEEAWGSGVFVTDRAVDTHVVNLRRKLEREPAEPRRLLSVRGQGYRFDA
jgi:two-component system alkaline phosphatase synthesis response regulator PhoP